MSDVTQKPDDTYYQELMGAAAFGHLDRDEQVAFDAWLASSDVGRLEFAELTAAVQMLPLSLDEATPSPELRSRIAAAVGASAVDAPASTPEAVEPVSIDAARSRRQSFLMSPAGRLLAAAAVLVVVVIGAFAVFDSIRSDTIESIGIDTVPDGFDGSLEYNVDAEELTFSVDAMPAAPDGQLYQLWLIGANGPESMGVMSGTSAVLDANRSDYQAFAITVEPGPGGSTAPTSDPILVAPLARSDEGSDV